MSFQFFPGTPSLAFRVPSGAERLAHRHQFVDAHTSIVGGMKRPEETIER